MQRDAASLNASVRKAIFALAGPVRSQGGAYLGTGDRLLGITTPALRRLARAEVGSVEKLAPTSALSLLDAWFASDVHELKVFAALLLQYGAGVGAWAGPAQVDGWLGHLGGWAQIDSLCSNVFQPDEMLGAWRGWKSWLRRWAEDDALGKRRASLVLLTGPVRRSDDARLKDLALRNVEKPSPEREILITKAVSWILRSLVAHHREAVADFVTANRAVLPAIAVREATAKLQTGRKTMRALEAARK